MNKKDIQHFRKHLKTNSELLSIDHIYSAYVMKESSEVYHEQLISFDLLEEEQKELYLNNFKKLLSGQLDEKMFVLKFQRDVETEQRSEEILYDALTSEDQQSWQAEISLLVDKMFQERHYETDVVVTFIRGNYLKPGNKGYEDRDEAETDILHKHGFIMCTINKTQMPKSELLFDYVEKEFKYNVMIDPVINLKAPLSGFLYPTFTEGVSNVNRVLYGAEKKFKIDDYFVEHVLNAEDTMTAEDDKIVFEEVVNQLAAEQLDTSTLSKMYEEIYQVIEYHDEEEETDPTLDFRDVEEVLKKSGVEVESTEAVRTAFETVAQDSRIELKAANVVPKATSKSIKIKTKVADVAIRPQDLKYVRQVKMDGKLCLMIEVEENTMIEGFEMIPEALFKQD